MYELLNLCNFGRFIVLLHVLDIDRRSFKKKKLHFGLLNKFKCLTMFSFYVPRCQIWHLACCSIGMRSTPHPKKKKIYIRYIKLLYFGQWNQSDWKWKKNVTQEKLHVGSISLFSYDLKKKNVMMFGKSNRNVLKKSCSRYWKDVTSIFFYKMCINNKVEI